MTGFARKPGVYGFEWEIWRTPEPVLAPVREAGCHCTSGAVGVGVPVAGRNPEPPGESTGSGPDGGACIVGSPVCAIGRGSVVARTAGTVGGGNSPVEEAIGVGVDVDIVSLVGVTGGTSPDGGKLEPAYTGGSEPGIGRNGLTTGTGKAPGVAPLWAYHVAVPCGATPDGEKGLAPGVVVPHPYHRYAGGPAMTPVKPGFCGAGTGPPGQATGTGPAGRGAGPVAGGAGGVGPVGLIPTISFMPDHVRSTNDLEPGAVVETGTTAGGADRGIATVGSGALGGPPGQFCDGGLVNPSKKLDRFPFAGTGLTGVTRMRSADR